MKQPTVFDTLESALETLSLLITIDWTNNVQANVRSKINPARYDSQPINAMARQLRSGVGFTDRQQLLAVTLVTKYRKQWAKNNYDVSNISKDTLLKFPLRTNVDRTRTLLIEDNMLAARYPYIPKIVQAMHEYTNTNSCGHAAWNTIMRRFEFAINAENALWLEEFAKTHNFELHKSFQDLLVEINNARDCNSVQLDIVNHHLELRNAPQAMLDWIADNVGDIEWNNFKPLALLATKLQFTLSQPVIDLIAARYPNSAELFGNKVTFIPTTEASFSTVLRKVQELDVDTVVVCSMDPVDERIIAYRDLKALCKSHMPEYNVIIVDHAALSTVSATELDLTTHKKNIILTTRVVTVEPDVIISTVGFMNGSKRKTWFQSATKIIYHCVDVDNRIRKYIKKNEGNIHYKRRD